MTRSTIEAYIEEQYDHYVTIAGGTALVAESRDALLKPVMATLADTERDLHGEATRLISQVLRGVRDGRSTFLKRELEWLVDYFNNPEDGAIGVEAVLDKAFPLGRNDGADKTLRRWTRDDYLNAARTRYQCAAEQTKAAADFDMAVQRVLDLMDSAGVASLGDLMLNEVAA